MSTDIGNKIRRLRKENKLSQERFGKKIGLSGKSISAYETGKVTPSLKVLENISNTYDVNIGHLRNTYRNKVEKTMENIQKELEELKETLEKI